MCPAACAPHISHLSLDRCSVAQREDHKIAQTMGASSQRHNVEGGVGHLLRSEVEDVILMDKALKGRFV